MAFEHWKPSTFTLDDYVLSWPSAKRQQQQQQQSQAIRPLEGPDEPLDQLDDGARGSWKELGLDERIASILQEEQGQVPPLTLAIATRADAERCPPSCRCKAPFELQRRIVTALLECHHMEISSPPSTGVSTAVLATSLHCIPGAPPSPSAETGCRSAPSLLFLATSSLRAKRLADRISKLAAPFGFLTECYRDDVPLSTDLHACREGRSPHVAVATIGRCVTLLQHEVLRLADLTFLCLDLSTSDDISRRAVKSHHTVSDVRNVLQLVGTACQVVVLCGPGYETSQLAKVIKRHQEASMKRNLLLSAKKQEARQKLEEEEDHVEDGRKKAVVNGEVEPVTPTEKSEKTLSEEWRKVVAKFEYTGLTPNDFLSAKRCAERFLLRPRVC